MKELPLSQMQISDVSAANDSSLEPCGDIPAPAANAQVLQLASRLCNLLKADMDRFEQQEDMSLEARTKAMMAFAKTIQFLEELIRHHFLTMGPTSWIAFLASVFDLLRRLLAVWSDRKATREENIVVYTFLGIVKMLSERSLMISFKNL